MSLNFWLFVKQRWRSESYPECYRKKKHNNFAKHHDYFLRYELIKVYKTNDDYRASILNILLTSIAKIHVNITCR